MGPFLWGDSKIEEVVKEWVEQSGELIIEFYQRHGGSSGDFYALNSFDQFHELMDGAHSKVITFVLRDKQLPLRGVVDEEFITQAKAHIEEGRKFDVYAPAVYPGTLELLGFGKSHDELVRELHEVMGREVWLGHELAMPNQYGEKNDAPDALIVWKSKQCGPASALR